jgi:hypothetical protein
MMSVNRRTFLGNLAQCSAGLVLNPWPAPAIDPNSTSIVLRPEPTAPVPVPKDFVGLGYEMSSIATTGLLSTKNHPYVNLVKGLGPAGVVRAGGIVADYTRYEPNGTSRSERQNTVITRADLGSFADFLHATGWRAIWSLNFAQGTVQDAIVEARAVAAVLGTTLLAFELGNEVENYGRGQKPFRRPPYPYETYRKEYSEWHSAIHKDVPGVRFAAPDTASSVEWVERIANDAKGDVQLLTTHYYRGDQKYGTAEQLLRPDPRLKQVLATLHAISARSGIPWRMCETNSFFGGGRPGVSDTFVNALWVLDYMLLLAQSGCSGVNIETGINQLGFVSSYSPIQDDQKGSNTAGPTYYGMLAFAQAVASCHQVLPIAFANPNINMTAYGLGSRGKFGAVVVVNKDELQDVRVSMKDLRLGRVAALRLNAPSRDSKSGITFGGSPVDRDGRWNPANHEEIREGAMTVPRMSAVVIRSLNPPERV